MGPRLSMARAINGSGGVEAEFHAGEQPDLGVHRFEQPVVQSVLDGGQDPFRCRPMRRWRSMNAGMWQRRAQPIQASRAAAAASTGSRKISRRDSLSLRGPIQPRVGDSHPDQLLLVPGGEILRALPQREPGRFQRADSIVGGNDCPAEPSRGEVWAPASSRRGPHTRRRSGPDCSAPLAHDTTWNGSAANTAPGQRSLTTSSMNAAPSAEAWVINVDRSGLSSSKNRRNVARGTAVGDPHQMAGVVVDDHQHILLPVGHLIDPDPPQPVESVGRPGSLSPHPHPSHDRPHHPPRPLSAYDLTCRLGTTGRSLAPLSSGDGDELDLVCSEGLKDGIAEAAFEYAHRLATAVTTNLSAFDHGFGRGMNHSGFGAHLLDWEGGCHAKAVRCADPGQSGSVGAGASRRLRLGVRGDQGHTRAGWG